jgi:hypothetical protein
LVTIVLKLAQCVAVGLDISCCVQVEGEDEFVELPGMVLDPPSTARSCQNGGVGVGAAQK